MEERPLRTSTAPSPAATLAADPGAATPSA
jgi:hypothetical protein